MTSKPLGTEIILNIFIKKKNTGHLKVSENHEIDLSKRQPGIKKTMEQ